MGEGGGPVSVNVDFKDVWTAVQDVGEWVSSEATVNLVNNGFMIPKGVASPNELSGWQGEPHSYALSKVWMGRDFGLFESADTRIRYGAVWYFGANHNGQGLYIGNCDVFFVVSEIGYSEKFNVTATIDNPLTVGNGVAQLGGDLTIKYYQYSSLSSTYHYKWFVRGDGYGRMWEL